MAEATGKPRAVNEKELRDEAMRKLMYGRTHRTAGQRLADWITKWAGSWTFIIIFFTYTFVWMGANIYLIGQRPFDPYPFILLNLTLSCLAAIQAPVILMSQNREAERDRVKAERDFAVNRKAEKEIEEVQAELKEIKSVLREIYAARVKK
ncbi:MAG: DUF1003 domain-containing protein [Candidatus Diapherotrites archaeon]|nr:DUF1003 domain-containing protein [Candidatus Micrarchaeota archaeon]